MDPIKNGAHDTFDAQITGYCFGDLPEQERTAFELHLLTCDACFHEVERLMAGIRAIRSSVDATSGALSRTELIGLLGISDDLDGRLGGHVAFAAAATMAYAFVSGEALLTEMSYFIDRFAHVAAWTVPLVFLWMGAAFVASLAVSIKLTRQDRSDALAWSVGTFLALAALMLVGAQFVLPKEATINIAFVPRTVVSANLRNYALYGLPLAVVFALVPFQFVITIQRDLARGRHENVLKFFSKDPLAISPRGSIFVPPKALGALLVVAVIYLVIANQYLLDNLVIGDHSELFTALIYVRIAAGLSFAGGCLAWYARMLNEAKREALALRSTSGPLVP